MRSGTTRWGVVLGATAVAAGAAAAAVATVAAARRWDASAARAVRRLHDPAAADGTPGVRRERYDPALLAAAPAPVQRYLAFALPPGQRAVRRARLEHVGEFASQPGRWSPVTSVQHITTEPPGFVWIAAISMAPLPVDVRVRDGYVHGVGSTHVAISGVLPLVSQEGTPEVAASALWRYLAEAVWCPTALLPSERLTWTAIDDMTARATLRDRGATAVADFHFGAGGEVLRVTGMRYRAVNGELLLTSTEGSLGNYTHVDGMMIPTEGELAWLLPEGPYAYWRARLVHTRYQYGDL